MPICGTNCQHRPYVCSRSSNSARTHLVKTSIDRNSYLVSQTCICMLLYLHQWWAKVTSVLILWAGVSVAPCRRLWTSVLAGMAVGSKTHPCVENRVNVVILVKCVFVVIVVKCVFTVQTLDRWICKITYFLLCTSLLFTKFCAGTVGLFFCTNFFHKHVTSMKDSVLRLIPAIHITDLNMYPSIIITWWTDNMHLAVLPSTQRCQRAHSYTGRYIHFTLSTAPIRNYC